MAILYNNGVNSMMSKVALSGLLLIVALHGFHFSQRYRVKLLALAVGTLLEIYLGHVSNLLGANRLTVFKTDVSVVRTETKYRQLSPKTKVTTVELFQHQNVLDKSASCPFVHLIVILFATQLEIAVFQRRGGVGVGRS